MMVFCLAHTYVVVHTMFLLGVLLRGCRLDVDLELVFALEQN
jgi:hypothetical protein